MDRLVVHRDASIACFLFLALSWRHVLLVALYLTLVLATIHTIKGAVHAVLRGSRQLHLL